MSKKTEYDITAYSTGYMAAILRTPISKCPFDVKVKDGQDWVRGYNRGLEFVKQTTTFKKQVWFGMESAS